MSSIAHIHSLVVPQTCSILFKAPRLWETAEALREAMGAPMQSVYCADYEQAVVAVRTELGEEPFATA